MKVRVRIAPSPTGQDLHIGTLYTALINWAFSRQNQGDFVVRIEDTDRQRLVKGAEKRFLQTLKNYGLEYDEGPDKKGKYEPYRQSERLELYKKYGEELVKKGKAYYCICSKERLDKVRKEQEKKKVAPKYDRYCLKRQEEVKKEIEKGGKFVIRLKVPDGKNIVFNDLIRGKISFPSKDIDDQVLLKSDGYPTYHLGVVVDDHLMEISHIIRGEEWISSTPKHILLYQALGWPLPIYCHSPLLRNPDKSKLSKRKNPVWASWYLKQGYLKEAVLNYLCLMGWSHPKEKTIFSLIEFVKYFKLEDISPVGPIFDLKKLDFINSSYIRQAKDEELLGLIEPFLKVKIEEDKLKQVIPLIKERMTKLMEINDLIEFLVKKVVVKKNMFKGKKAKEELKGVSEVMRGLEKWDKERIYQKVREIFDKHKYDKKTFYPNLYLAIEGRDQGLPVFESMEILGKTETLKRLEKALGLL